VRDVFGRPAVPVLVGASVGAGTIGLAAWVSSADGTGGWFVLLAPLFAFLAGVSVRFRASAGLAAGLAGALTGCLALIPLARRWNEHVYEPIFDPEFTAVLFMAVGMLPVGLATLAVWAWTVARQRG
jgi:hypothetical protein